jgi:hypothetical protein
MIAVTPSFIIPSRSRVVPANWVNNDAGYDNHCVAYGNGQWVIGGAPSPGTSNQPNMLVNTSPNLPWTSNISTYNNQIYDVVYANGLWVGAAADMYVYVATDAFGVWKRNRIVDTVQTHLTGIAYGNGNWVVIGGEHRLWASSDPHGGWVKTNLPSGLEMQVIAYGNGLWIVTTNYGYLYTATNPFGPWTDHTALIRTPSVFGLSYSRIVSIVYDGTKWIMTGGYNDISGNWISTSAVTDDPTVGPWIRNPIPFADYNSAGRMAVDTRGPVVVGMNSYDFKTTTDSATTWQSQPHNPSLGGGLTDVDFGADNYWVRVGSKTSTGSPGIIQYCKVS